MQRTQVDSSNINAVGYDGGGHLLELEFVSGAIYQYDDVSHEVAEGMMRAASKGRYFIEHIKGRYRYHRIN